MSLDNITPSKQPTKDHETQTSGGGGGGGGGNGGGGGGRKASILKPPEQTLKCPRCDSPNTKFCYYNNYSLTQPRYFCKTCRRYWTRGGALRNVPIGGGCRKNKKTRVSSSRFGNGDSSSKDSSLDIGGLSLLSGPSPPAMDFQFGGINNNIPPRLNHFSSSFGDSSNNPPPFINLDSLGFNFPSMKQDRHHQLHGGLSNFQEMGVANNLHLNPTSNLASSIESLSSINQDLHWRLQQQRLATLLGGSGGDGGGGGGGGGGGVGGGEPDQQQQQNQIAVESQTQKLQPILFHNLEIPKPSMSSDLRKDGGGGSGGGLETEWFFDNNYAPVNVNPSSTEMAPTDINTAGNYQIGSINNWNIGMQAWNQFNQYSPLP